LKSEWWDLSAYEVSWILLTVKYIALDHLTWNDPNEIWLLKINQWKPWCTTRNLFQQKFQKNFYYFVWCNRRSSWTSTGRVEQKIRLPVLLLRIRHHPKTCDSADFTNQLAPTRAAGDIFSDSDRFSCMNPDPKLLNLVPGSFPESFQIEESDFCSDSSCHRSNQNLPMFYIWNDHSDSCYCGNKPFSMRTIEVEHWKHSVRHAEATIGERGSGAFYCRLDWTVLSFSPAFQAEILGTLSIKPVYSDFFISSLFQLYRIQWM